MNKLFFIKNFVWFTLGFIIVFSSLMSPNFLTIFNISNVLVQSSINGIMAIGMTFLIISGYFDLSIGSVMALSAAISISLQSHGILIACLSAILLGTTVGIINGLLVTKAKMNAFIVTFATMTIVRGLVLLITNQRTITGANLDFIKLSNNKVFNMPIPVIIFAIGVGIAYLILKYTTLGRNTYAIGGNLEASIYSGINVDFYKIIYFGICSFTASISGVIVASRLNSATVTLGEQSALLVIAAVLLGGTSLDGGYGGVIRSLSGVLILGVLNNILNLLNIASYYQGLIIGAILIFVIVWNSYYSELLKIKKQIVKKRLEYEN